MNRRKTTTALVMLPSIGEPDPQLEIEVLIEALSQQENRARKEDPLGAN